MLGPKGRPPSASLVNAECSAGTVLNFPFETNIVKLCTLVEVCMMLLPGIITL